MKLINPEVRVENTNRCNARCSICPRDKLTRPLATMDMQLFNKLIAEVKVMGAETISIFGYGEPLLDKTITDKIQLCTDFGLETFITTNASLLDIDVATNILKAGLTHIRFSVHGVHGNYENIHGLNYNNTQRNIANFIAINNIKFQHQCKVSMSCIPLSGETVDFFREQFESSVDWLEIWKPHNWTDGKRFRDIKTKEEIMWATF